MLIGVIVFSFLASLVVLVFAIPISIKFGFDSKNGMINLKVKFLGITFTLAPKKEKKKRKKKKDTGKSAKKDQSEGLKKLYEDKGIKGFVEFMLSVVKSIWSIAKGVVKASVIKRLKIKVIVTGKDAADTAIGTGWAYSVVCPVVSMILDSAKGYSSSDIDITPDYREDAEPYFEVFVQINIKFKNAMKLIAEGIDEYTTLLKPVIDYIDEDKKENKK